MSNKKLRQKVNRAYLLVKPIIDKWDPAGLSAMGSPGDEYDSESAEVAKLALTPLSNAALGKKIQVYLIDRFGSGSFAAGLKQCEDIARQINESLSTKPWEPIETDTIVIDATRITGIREDGISYSADGAGECFIDFAVCRRNWIDYVNVSGDFQSESPGWAEKTKCVAIRDITSSFFEFFSEPKVRVKIEPKPVFWGCLKRNRRNRYKKFHELQSKITEAGWSTFDRS
jgi:hypothetical protein